MTALPPEPPELTEWANRVEANQAKKAAENAVECAACGKPHGDSVHLYLASRSTARCQFVEPCPNLDDPVLCKWHNGEFAIEAGCPVHDTEVSR